MSLHVGDRVVYTLGGTAHHTVTYIQSHVPEVLLILLTLLMMSTWMIETCIEFKQTNIRTIIVC